jgi:hypothetical protein
MSLCDENGEIGVQEFEVIIRSQLKHFIQTRLTDFTENRTDADIEFNNICTMKMILFELLNMARDQHETRQSVQQILQHLSSPGHPPINTVHPTNGCKMQCNEAVGCLTISPAVRQHPEQQVQSSHVDNADDALHGCEHRVVADRIEAGTFLCALAATGGQAYLRHGRGDHLDAGIEKLQAAGARVTSDPQGIAIEASGRLQAQSFRTTEYPGFPTDMQAQFMALNVIASGSSKVTETIFENRFMHVNEMVRLGAKIQVDGKVALIEGVPRLSGATVMATDLRASASLVIAALVAEGQTVVDRIYHLDRGYDHMETKLRGLGADIERIR